MSVVLLILTEKLTWHNETRRIDLRRRKLQISAGADLDWASLRLIIRHCQTESPPPVVLSPAVVSKNASHRTSRGGAAEPDEVLSWSGDHDGRSGVAGWLHDVPQQACAV
ncbi:hypothetical protein CRG98_039827 [Punica granatum]|uniref:Uncharacterized protein n=1 Tax=Punica granatum TaxID=22663 RepID=A0A2I0I737_PUNGR|nr:hypothetical protein CRG98_039827 [Punica granatum]